MASMASIGSREQDAWSRNRRVQCDELYPFCWKRAVGDPRCVCVPDARWREGTQCATFGGFIVKPVSGTRTIDRSAILRERTTRCPDQSPPLSATGQSFRRLHMQLLYHVFSGVSTFKALKRDVDSIYPYALDHASTAPYILDQLDLFCVPLLNRQTRTARTARSRSHRVTSLRPWLL